MYILSGRFCPNVWIGVEFGVEIFRNREVCRNKKRSTEALLCVVLPGFEPRQAEPKTAVLPLHHKTILTLKTLLSSQKRCKDSVSF